MDYKIDFDYSAPIKGKNVLDDGYNLITIEHTEQEKEFVGNILHMQPNDTSILFFRDENIDNINKRLIDECMVVSFDKMGKRVKIQPQDKFTMIKIMKHVYFSNIQNLCSPDKEVERLNNLTLELILPTVINGMYAQIRYLETYDRTKNVPLERPISTNNKAQLSPITKLFGF